MMRLMAALADSIRAEFIPYLILFMIPLNLSAIPTAKRFSSGIPDAQLPEFLRTLWADAGALFESRKATQK